MTNFPQHYPVLCTFTNFPHKLHTLQITQGEITYVYNRAYTTRIAAQKQSSNITALYRGQSPYYLEKQLHQAWIPLNFVRNSFEIKTEQSIKLHKDVEQAVPANLQEVENAPYRFNLQKEHMKVETYSFDSISADNAESTGDTEDREYQQWQENRGQVNEKEMAEMIASSEAAILTNQSKDVSEFAEGGHPSKLSTSIPTSIPMLTPTSLVDEL